MLSKRDQYLARFSHCVANAQAAASDELRQTWSHLAGSYRTLLEFENRYPTRPDGLDGLGTGASSMPVAP